MEKERRKSIGQYGREIFESIMGKRKEVGLYSQFLDKDVNPAMLEDFIKSELCRVFIDHLENMRDALAKDLAYSGCLDLTKIAFRKGEIFSLNNLIAKLNYIRNEERTTYVRPNE